jgi:hypothetical protein
MHFQRGGILVRRSDGRRLKSLGPFIKMVPYIMTRRSDAQIFSKQTLVIDHIEAYIHAKRVEGIKLSYLHVFVAIYVRMIAQRPLLNRFVINSQIYARKDISISLAIKRSLHDEGEETTVKFVFTGRETIFEVAEIIDRCIGENLPAGVQNDADKLAAWFMSLPNGLIKTAVGTIKWMDRHNMMPKKIVEASPFHTTMFFTYLKSIKLDYIYHHLYDFGTTGIFVALGKVKKMAVVEGDAAVVKSVCEIGYVLDERLCDGLYFANSFKLVKNYMEDLKLLETTLDEIIEDVE